MATELEAKMKVDDLDAVRALLGMVGAKRVGLRHEVNAFFDTPERALRSRDNGLRLRTMTDEAGDVTTVITFKGPQAGSGANVGGQLKQREEIEFAVGSFDDASALLDRLGYRPTLAFEKRRETWELDGCLVELDELPHLGTFVEIEAPGHEQIMGVRRKIGLHDSPLITRGYIRMIDDLVKQRPELGPRVTF